MVMSFSGGEREGSGRDSGFITSAWEKTAEKDEYGTGVDECSLLHESTEDYGAKRSEQRTGTGMRNARNSPR
jgi:hypothetical protein